jgi:hypothetical protein
MASSSSDRAPRDVQRLFNLGAVSSMTDAQLLDWVVSPAPRQSRSPDSLNFPSYHFLIGREPTPFQACCRQADDGYNPRCYDQLSLTTDVCRTA